MSSTISSTTTSSNSGLFPTSNPTSSPNSGEDKAKNSTNVYYLVFLGVLVILMCIALCLAVRAMRMRRRYRTAARHALERGEAVPDTIREDFWGLGGLAGWNSDGWDRLGMVRIDNQLKEGDKKWDKLPVLVEAEAEKEKVQDGELWEDIRPLTVQSIRPFPQEELDAHRYADSWDRPIPRTTQSRRSPLFGRNRTNDGNFNGLEMPSNPDSTSGIPEIEADRTIGPGERLRVAVVLQMPTSVANHQRYKHRGESDEEEVAWENGMEIGVWEGVLDGKAPAPPGPVDLGTMPRPSPLGEDGRGLVRSRSEESYGHGDIASYR
ncbi:hypothetical protein L204_105040 [Cryptococcus depauperatus]|nr:hypothetical protein L204_03687 [Cryptococcus depauperatus CBS 7855]